MRTDDSASIRSSPLVGALFGTLFFFCIFGVELLNPSYIDWQLDRDAAQHYLGWEFFRYEPWHLPPGRIDGYGIPAGSSVTYTDSIPILAMLFKALRVLLPRQFQYVGSWVLLCYALQGFFGWLLASLITKSNRSRGLMTVLFIVSPSLLNRALGHHALMAHWLLLGALYLGLQSRESLRRRHPHLSPLRSWTIGIILSAMIHVYLLAMVVAIYFAWTVSDWFAHRSRHFSQYSNALAPLALGAVALYLAGAFVVSAKDWSTGEAAFTAFSMNLLAPVIPGCMGSPSEAAYVSYFLTPRPFAARAMGLFEGFNYLGLGVLILLGIAGSGRIIPVLSRLRLGTRTDSNREVEYPVPLPLAIVTLLMGLYSLSNIVTLGTRRLLDVPLGQVVSQYCGVFRASGRFFWPLGYLVLWVSLRELIRHTSKFRVAGVGILGALVGLQLADLSGFFAYFASHNRTRAKYESPLRSAFWVESMKDCDQVLYYPPGDDSYYVPLGLLAAPRGVGMNVAYKARSDGELAASAERTLAAELESGNLRPRALYVFKDPSIFEALRSKTSTGETIIQEVDGLYVAHRVQHDE